MLDCLNASVGESGKKCWKGTGDVNPTQPNAMSLLHPPFPSAPLLSPLPHLLVDVHPSSLAVVNQVLVEHRVGLALDLHAGDPIGVDVVGLHVSLATVKHEEAAVLAMVDLGEGEGSVERGGGVRREGSFTIVCGECMCACTKHDFCALCLSVYVYVCMCICKHVPCVCCTEHIRTNPCTKTTVAVPPTGNVSVQTCTYVCQCIHLSVHLSVCVCLYTYTPCCEGISDWRVT